MRQLAATAKSSDADREVHARATFAFNSVNVEGWALYAEAEIGFTVADAGKGDFWLVNEKGVKLRLKSPSSMGVALDLGVEGVDIRREK